MEVWCIFSRRWLHKPFICHGNIPNEEKTRGTTYNLCLPTKTCKAISTPTPFFVTNWIKIRCWSISISLHCFMAERVQFHHYLHAGSAIVQSCSMIPTGDFKCQSDSQFKKKTGKPTISNSKTTTLTKQLHMFKVNHRHHSWKTSSHFLFQTLIFGSFPWFKQLQHIWKSQNTTASAPT